MLNNYISDDELVREAALTADDPDGIGIVSWDDRSYWRNEPVGASSFQVQRYCRSCGDGWECCTCSSEEE